MKFRFGLLILIVSVVSAAAPPKALPGKPSSKNLAAPPPPSTQKQAQAASGQAGQSAVVKVDSAMVYDQPSFDGSVISYLPSGQKVRISKRTYGADVGLFFMIRLPNSKIGYIADIDVQPLKSKKKKHKKGDEDHDEDFVAKEKAREKAKEADQEKEKAQEADDNQEERERKYIQREPVAFKQWVGGYIANWGFKEKITGIDAQERLNVFGVKYTSPKLLPGSIVDLNFGIHLGAPSYYDEISVGKPSGYLLFLDGEFLSPMILAQDSFGYFGFGPLINYTSVRIQTINSQAVDSNDLRLGLALTVGYSHRLGPLCGRLEGKYIIEKTQQTVIVLALQAPL